MNARSALPSSETLCPSPDDRPSPAGNDGADATPVSITTTIDRVVVVVPAHDEQYDIGACLESVQVARRNVSVPASIVVVADCCTDDTVARALDALRSGRDDLVLVTEAGGAGAARQAGTDCALLDVSAPPNRSWIACTDADTIVDPDWLEIQLSYARAGVVGVAGVVRLAPDAPVAPSFQMSYGIEADGSHLHVHGANIGFRADAYRRAGGWNPLITGEDHDLWNRLRAQGPVVSTSLLSVQTSARLQGRAPNGFAADLAALMSAGQPVG